MDDFDVIVIGAGLGGLTAAASLSRKGLRVQVLEQHYVPGGYAHFFPRKHRETQGKYFFDVALHQTGDLKPGRPMHTLLSELGILDRIRVSELPIIYRSVFPQHDLLVPADLMAYEELLAALFPKERRGIRSLFNVMLDLDHEAVGLAHALLDGAPDPAAAPVSFRYLTASLREMVEGHVHDPRFLAIFSQLWGYVGLPPGLVSAFLFARVWASFHLGGAFYVHGGGQRLSNAFVDVIRERGGRVQLRTRVARIVLDDDERLIGVRTARGEEMRARIVISNASAPATFHELIGDEHVDPATVAQIDRLAPSTSLIEAYIGIDGDAGVLGLPEHEYFLNRDYDPDGEWEYVRGGGFERTSLLLANNSSVNPSQTALGKSIVEVAILADGRHWLGLPEDAYERKKRAVTEVLVAGAERLIPDLRRRIEVLEVGTPHTMHRYSLNPLGAVYGYAPTADGHTIFKPAPRTNIPGVYLAGAWTFPSGGFEGAMLSGAHTAALILRDLDEARRSA